MKPKINVFTTLRNNVYLGVDPREGDSYSIHLGICILESKSSTKHVFFSKLGTFIFDTKKKNLFATFLILNIFILKTKKNPKSTTAIPYENNINDFTFK